VLAPLALLLAAAVSAGTQARKPAAAAPGALQLDGVWKGQEVDANVGMRHSSLTFTKDGGSFAYEDAGGMGVKITVRLQSLKVEGALVRFAVPGGGKIRHYTGRWDGRRIAGTIAADAAGATPLGTFELTRPVYEDSRPLSPNDLAAMEARRRPEPGLAPENGAGTTGTTGTTEPPAARSEIERKREAGTRQLEQRLQRVAALAAELVGSIQEYQAACGEGGQPLFDQPTHDCDGMVRNVGRLAVAVGRGLDEAEDEARRNWVEPGTVRRLREENGLDSSAWDDLSRRVRQLEAEASRRR
jgi:hypothetical protein